MVESLRAGDAQAFRELIERLQQPITGYLHRLVGNREVALDLAQDTFLQVYKEIGKTSGELKLDAWIYRIATNYGLRHLNRKRLRQVIRIESDEAFDD
ncbi:MAG TPA: RNA polymerase sigma factor, partial [Ktedonobacteraceae bacterium]|nr:RNA polymerase sigma factor [Ktedonobacteraceae bacterium]